MQTVYPRQIRLIAFGICNFLPHRMDESTCNINGILTYTDSVSMKTLPFITPMVTQINTTIVNNLSFNLTATLSMSGTVYNYTVTQMR